MYSSQTEPFVQTATSGLLFPAEISRVKALILILERSCVRTLLLISVLVTLCISEGVGLQLLPIPSAPSITTGLAEARLIEARTNAPSPPPREESISSRVEIIAPKQEGVSHRQSVQIHTAILLTTKHPNVRFPGLVYSSSEPDYGYSGSFVSQGAGRAPPLPA
jgi:hypothetical protein